MNDPLDQPQCMTGSDFRYILSVGTETDAYESIGHDCAIGSAEWIKLNSFQFNLLSLMQEVCCFEL